MGVHMVIMDTREAANDLLEKRSSNYSSRQSVLCSWICLFILISYFQSEIAYA